MQILRYDIGIPYFYTSSANNGFCHCCTTHFNNRSQIEGCAGDTHDTASELALSPEHRPLRRSPPHPLTLPGRPSSLILGSQTSDLVT